MELVEYQSKRLLEEAGLLVPRGELCHSARAAAACAERVGAPVALKAQVAIDGHGKADGVRLATGQSQAHAAATEILGMEIGGHVVHFPLVEEALPLRKTMYAAFALNRDTETVVGMLSSAGGFDVGELAHSKESRRARVSLPAPAGWHSYVERKLVKQAVIDRKLTEKVTDVFGRMWQVLKRYEVTCVEVNPLALASLATVLPWMQRSHLTTIPFFAIRSSQRRLSARAPKARWRERSWNSTVISVYSAMTAASPRARWMQSPPADDRALCSLSLAAQALIVPSRLSR